MPRQRGTKSVKTERCKTIYDMYCIGVLVLDISKYYGMKRPTVSNIIRREKQKKLQVTMKKRGRNRKLSERGMRLFRNYVLDNCFDPLYVIVTKFNATTGLQLSERTGRRYVRILKMNSNIAIQKPFISTKIMASRILWARTHKDWTLSQWSNVLFTDESSFSVRPLKNRLRVWRHKGCRLQHRHVVPTFKSGHKTVSVWGGFSMLGRTPLVATVGKFDQHTYRSIIDAHITPFMNKTHGGTESFMLQEDNCGPHRAKSIAIHLTNNEVSRMKWPP